MTIYGYLNLFQLTGLFWQLYNVLYLNNFSILGAVIGVVPWAMLLLYYKGEV